MSAEHDPFILELESAGLDEIRGRLARGAYNDVGRRRSRAEDWVAQKERDDKAAVRAGQNEIASRTADAAERQATAAELATRIAVAALVVAVGAAILSIIAMVKH
jgi:hypothetical protein